MEPELYDDVYEIVLDIVNASSAKDKKSSWEAYRKLAKLCSENEGSASDHPFQWETLGDFTTDKNVALDIYKKALVLASRADLPEYIGSICLAMAECHIVLGNAEQAWQSAIQANAAALSTDDLDLRRNISELLLQLGDGT